MEGKILIICFTILLCISQINFAQERGVGNRAVSNLPPKEKRWALLIGVSQYEDGNITSLPGANNDAKALRDALRDYAGFDEKQIIMLTTDEPKDRQPTKNNILRYLGNLNGMIPKDGLLIVAFSGHGLERQKRPFLLASDTPYNDNIRVLERTALNVSNDFKELIRDTGVGQVIILLDACRNDPSSGRSSSDNLLSEAYKNGFSFDVKNKEILAFATLYATSLGERAYEYTSQNKGYFTWAFIEGLKGAAANQKGEVTLGNLVKFIEKQVPKQVKIDLGSNKLQRPFSVIEGYKSDELVIGISNYRESLSTASIPPTANEAIFWQTIEKSNQTKDFYIYLDKCLNGEFNGTYKTIAENNIGRLKKEATNAWSKFSGIARNLIKYAWIEPFSEEMAEVELDGKWGFVDKTGREIIPPKYDSVGPFSEGLAVVRMGTSTNSKAGFVDKTGREVIPLKYESAGDFSEGLALTKVNGKQVFIDKSERQIISLNYENMDSFSEGLAPAKSNGKWGFIDKSGSQIIAFKYDLVESFSENLALVTLGGKKGFIDKTGKEIIPIKYNDAESFAEGLAIVEINNKKGAIDKTGKEIIQLRFSELGKFSEDLAAAQLDDKWGFIDKTGKEIIPFQFEEAGKFEEGIAPIGMGDNLGFINKMGKIIISAKYDDQIWSRNIWKEGYVPVKLDGKQGFVDIYGNEYFDF